MKPLRCNCPLEMVGKWWLPLTSEGYDVILVDKDERADAIWRELFGDHNAALREQYLGGFVIMDGVMLIVGCEVSDVRKAQRRNSKSVALYYRCSRPSPPFYTPTIEEQRALDKLETIFAKNGIALNKGGRLKRLWMNIWRSKHSSSLK